LKPSIYTTVFGSALISYAAILGLSYNVLWVIIFTSAALIYGSLSNIVAVRKLYFLASAAPHAALFAVTLSLPISKLIGGDSFVYASIFSLALIYVVGCMIYKGFDIDVATSMFVGASTSLTVILIFYVLTKFPVEYSLSAVIMGDPLLVSWREGFIVMVIAAITYAAVHLTFDEQLSIGLDRASAMLSGIRVWLYDLLAYTLLGIGAVALIKIAGYILEHVLLLLPPAISITRARSAREAFSSTLLLSVASSLAGLHLSLITNLPPSGMIGLILILLYLVSYIRGRAG